MTNWSDLAAMVDNAVDLHLRDDGWIRPVSGGSDVPVRLAIEHPTDTDRLIGAGIERARPWVEIFVASFPALRKGDTVLVGKIGPFTGWRIAEAPKRPGDGRQWRAEVEPLGVVAE